MPTDMAAAVVETGMVMSEEELAEWGRRIGSSVRPPVFLMLRGPVGAGKSVLAQERWPAEPGCAGPCLRRPSTWSSAIGG